MAVEGGLLRQGGGLPLLCITVVRCGFPCGSDVVGRSSWEIRGGAVWWITSLVFVDWFFF